MMLLFCNKPQTKKRSTVHNYRLVVLYLLSTVIESDDRACQGNKRAFVLCTFDPFCVGHALNASGRTNSSSLPICKSKRTQAGTKTSRIKSNKMLFKATKMMSKSKLSTTSIDIVSTSGGGDLSTAMEPPTIADRRPHP